jgi:hypothetical protein
LQDSFVSIHRNLTELRGKSAANRQNTAQGLSKAVETLNAEKMLLTARLSRVQAKMDSEGQFQHVDFKNILEATSKLRKLQEEEIQLQQRSVETVNPIAGNRLHRFDNVMCI